VDTVGLSICILVSHPKVILTNAALDGTAPDLDLILLPGVAFDEECNRVSNTPFTLDTCPRHLYLLYLSTVPADPRPARTG
jgi:hypothetical protein